MIVTQALLPAALAFIMFAMGLTMAPQDFRLVFTQPRPILVALVCKLLALPLAGLAVVLLWRPLPAEFAVGLLILAACPAGVTSSLLTHLAGGRVALAAAVTAVTSLAATVTLPLLTNEALSAFAGFDHAVDLPVARMTMGVFAVDTLPLLAGLALQRVRPALAARLGRLARPLANLLFLAIVAGAFASQYRTLVDHAADAVPPALALNLAAMAIGWGISAAAGLPVGERVAVVMENGLQNSALGIFVAATLLESGGMMVPSIVYALVMNVTALSFVAWVRRRVQAPI
ncbi:MAG: bile acid:sodium symporter family protein [Actinomycetota bacterium]